MVDSGSRDGAAADLITCLTRHGSAPTIHAPFTALAGVFITGKPVIRPLIFFFKIPGTSSKCWVVAPTPFFRYLEAAPWDTHVPTADHVMYVRNMNYAALGRPGSPRMLCLGHSVDGLCTGV